MSKAPKWHYFTAGLNDPEAQVMVLWAGWPDTGEMWRNNLVEQFSDQYRIISVTIPGYPLAEKNRMPFFGFTFDQLMSGLVETLAGAIQEPCRRRPICVAHDWGGLLLGEFLMRKPEYFEKVIQVDVSHVWAGPEAGTTVASILWGKRASMPLRKMIGIAMYQSIAIFCYFFGRFALVQTFFANFMRKMKVVKYIRNPDVSSDSDLSGCHTNMGYLYVQFWWHLWIRDTLGSTRQELQPACPILFAYGAGKPFNFHTQSYLDAINKRTDGSEVIAYQGGDHWFFFDPTSPNGAQFAKDIAAFLTQESSPSMQG